MTERPDLHRYLQRRRLRIYERSMARLSYAYGVDVRRSRWLASSTVGNSLVRAVDRRWSALTDDLMRSELRDPGPDVATHLLERIRRVRQLLRAPLPSIRVVTDAGRQTGQWPLVTPLGPTHGDVHWLVLDVEGLARAPTDHLDFLLASGLGHLQCDHGVFFTAHLLAARRQSLAFRALRTALRPWSKVMVFSADRAGMLGAGNLSTALSVMRARAQMDDAIDWMPHWPELEVREAALEEFDRSVVMARLRAIRARDGADADISIFEAAADARDHDEVSTEPADEPVRGSEPIGIPEDAWSLARCDARLTERLGLL